MASPSAGLTGNSSYLKSFGVLAFLLALLLCGLFSQSFEEGMTLFANDGPLGAISSKAGALPGALTGLWQDLEWIGREEPSASPCMNILLAWVLKPVAFSKFYAPLALFFLGMSTWAFIRSMGFHGPVCVLGGLAAAFHMNTFSNACWGLPTRALTLGSILLSLAALQSGSRGRMVLKAPLAGLAVGMAIMEGFDVGAIYSVYVAAFAMFLVLAADSGAPTGGIARRLGRGAGLVAVIALVAALVAAHTLDTLVQTQLKGVTGKGLKDSKAVSAEQKAAEAERMWNFNTPWSLPKMEILRVVVPGLFGYRMHDAGRQLYEGSYWGVVGQMPGHEETRHSGSGEYAGVLVVLIALFALAQAARKKENPFTPTERRWVWFWAVTALVSLLFAFGRHAPFYRIVYAMPLFSTIRNPIKFMHPFQLALISLFAFGLEALWRRYLAPEGEARDSIIEHFNEWWKSAKGFEKHWILGSIFAVAAGLLAWLIYASSKANVIAHLQKVGFQDANLAATIAKFSLGEVGWSVLFLILSVLAVAIILSGALRGSRKTWAAIALGFLLVLDLCRANANWIIYYNYRDKLASEGVVDFLKEGAQERRVAMWLMPLRAAPLLTPQAAEMQNAMMDWLENHFKFYNIPSVNIAQWPRMPELEENFLRAFSPPPDGSQLQPCTRLFELTSTRYLIGMAGFLDFLNTRADPIHHRYRIHRYFDYVPKNPNRPAGNYSLDELTTVIKTNGTFAVFEFTGALPRFRMVNRWQVETNDAAALATLGKGDFDLQTTLLVSDPVPPAEAQTATNAAAGQVRVIEYAPKHIVLEAEGQTSSILASTDRYSESWKVLVDGKPEKLLRCNYLARGILLSPGKHRVELVFQPPVTSLYVSLAAMLLGLVVAGLLLFTGVGSGPAAVAAAGANPAPAENPLPATPTPPSRGDGARSKKR
jgi:hypothetical protein